MKILFIIPSLLCGGAEKLIVDILANIDYENYNVSLLTFYKQEVYGNIIPAKVKRIRPFFIDTRWHSLQSKLLGKKISKKLDYCKLIYSIDKDYDCIVSFLEGFSASIHEKLRKYSRKNITFVHTDLMRYADSLLQFDVPPADVYSMMDKIVFVSQNAKYSFEKVFPRVGTEKIVLRNFIDIENVMQKSQDYLDFRKDCPIITTVGRVEPVKGYDLLIDVCKELQKNIESFKIIIVGNGSDAPRIAELIVKNGLQNHIQMVGFQKNPYPYIKLADIFVSTSLAEGFPLVLCEAMTLGKPIIASRTDGANELLSDGSGILVDREDKQYADAIVQLLNNRVLYDSYVNKGLNKSIEFDKHAYLNKLYSIIKS